VLATAHECGHWDRLERFATYPFKNGEGEDQGDAYDISALNPLDKVRPAVQRGMALLADIMKIGKPDEQARQSLFGIEGPQSNHGPL
jgi:hypothetical protein